ncbi:MAG: hypothetical protein V1755_09625, partial [Chloroflexota bacterium]
TAQVVRGNVGVWLHEELFRLPDRKELRSFPRWPRSEGMLRAFSRRKNFTQRASRGGGSWKSVAAPIEDQGLLLGILQVTRLGGPAFGPSELALLESIVGVVAVGLYASLRVEIERFRLGELNLVRQVSAQIGTVLHLDELSRRVCDRIQKAFNYYYVGIFTLRLGEKRLRYRSSARSRRTKAQTSPLALDVDFGQGLIGSAAASGQVINVQDVRADARYRFIEPLPATRSEVAHLGEQPRHGPPGAAPRFCRCGGTGRRPHDAGSASAIDLRGNYVRIIGGLHHCCTMQSKTMPRRYECRRL